MRTSAVAGVVFANASDDMLNKLTKVRSMASVPFGARYRLIDFTLSNLVNAGVGNVGVITKENYRSLMDHIGNGVSWDLDRKNGGLYILPPYISSGIKRYTGTVDALMGAMNYVERCMSEYIILCNADTIANVDISEAMKSHIARNADITVVYHHGHMPMNHGEKMILEFDGDEKVKSVSFNGDGADDVNYEVGITIISRDLLIQLINEAYENDSVSINRDIIAAKLKQLKIYGFEHKNFVVVLDSLDTYYDASMALLKSEVRQQLFDKNRPIFTKTRDDMPTRYGTKASVNNCFIADGCVIDGTVKNSILFRGVKIEKGSVVENCILMQGTAIGENAQLFNVISDKNASVGADMVLKGTPKKCFFIKKNQIL